MENSMKQLSLASYKMDNLNPAMDSINGIVNLDDSGIDLKKVGILLAMTLVKKHTMEVAQLNQKEESEELKLFDFCEGLSKIDLSNPEGVNDFINNMLKDKDLSPSIRAEIENLQSMLPRLEQLQNDMAKQQKIMSENPKSSSKYIKAAAKYNKDDIELQYLQDTYKNKVTQLASKAQAMAQYIQNEQDLIDGIMTTSTNN